METVSTGLSSAYLLSGSLVVWLLLAEGEHSALEDGLVVQAVVCSSGALLAVHHVANRALLLVIHLRFTQRARVTGRVDTSKAH